MLLCMKIGMLSVSSVTDLIVFSPCLAVCMVCLDRLRNVGGI